MRRTIWTSEIDFTNLEKLRKEAEENDDQVTEAMSDDEFIDYLEDQASLWRDDEICNLRIRISNPILVIADLGLWSGRKTGYKLLRGCFVSDILCAASRDSNAYTVYADAYNVRAEDSHHDGTNCYLFRELIGPESRCLPLLDAIYSGKDYTALMRRYSRSILPYVAGVYGWPVAGRRRKAAA